MDVDTAYELIKLCFTQGLEIAVPIVLVALALGLTVSIFQTVTSVQDQTLAFVPKVLGTAFCIWLISPWILTKLGNLMALMIQRSANILQ